MISIHAKFYLKILNDSITFFALSTGSTSKIPSPKMKIEINILIKQYPGFHHIKAHDAAASIIICGRHWGEK